MSLLKQILSPFIEFENKPQEAAPAATPEVSPAYNPVAEPVNDHPLFREKAVTTSVPSQNSAQRKTGITVLPEHQQYFEKLIDDANAKNPLFQGTDYKEFTDSKNEIGNITDEETKYKTAFNVLKRLGLTKEKLVSTAHEYHNIIGRDMNSFQGAHAQNYRKEVNEKELLIQKKAAELVALSERTTALKNEIGQLSKEITETKQKLDLTKNSFLLAGENKQAEIQAEVQKIQSYF